MRILKVAVVVLAALAVPAALGAPTVSAAFAALNALRTDGVTVAPTPPAYDPAKPTAVVVVGDRGAVVSDTLAPYEILATTGAFNVYTVASESRPLPLTGGLDLVPDLTFAGLERLLGGPADVVVVPAMPDVGRPSTEPVTDWLAAQADGGALLLGICNGAAVLASAGLLDGHRATAHWLRIDGWERTYPAVEWVRGTRYVDDEVITTAGILSGIDGTLHVVERLIGADAAAEAARSIGWAHHHPGGPAPMEQARLAPEDSVVAFNTAFGWDRQRIGVLLTDGVGEIELASVFDTYGQSLAAATIAVGDAPVRSRHGLTFVPRADTGAGLDRLVVPGTSEHDPVLRMAAPTHPHQGTGFPYDGVLQDLARTTDVATAEWTAKVLEYPIDHLALAGDPWPWTETLRPLALSALGALLALAGFWLAGSMRHRGPGRPAPAAAPAVQAGATAGD